MATFNMTFQSRDKPFKITFGEVYRDEIIIIDGEPYEGSYTVTPKIYIQKLYTKDKVMQDDVTVEGIPYAETSNPSGTTAVIAS